MASLGSRYFGWCAVAGLISGLLACEPSQAQQKPEREIAVAEMTAAGEPTAEPEPQTIQPQPQIHVDSAMTLDQALEGQDVPEAIRDRLVILDVQHLDFNGETRQGQIIVHDSVADEVLDIFDALLAMRFPIESVIPVVQFGFDDDRSMTANNSSGFNYRTIAGTNRLSNHAKGVAIDLNPRLNPYIRRGVVMPENGGYDPNAPGTIVADDAVVRLFESHGWSWGGYWRSVKDYQHFDKAHAFRE